MSRILRSIAWAALVAAIVPAAGCRGTQMYEGPRRSKAEVAQVHLTGNVLVVDGACVAWHAGFFGPIEFLPGPHSVTFEHRWDNYWKETITRDFSVEAGRRYSMHTWEDTKISEVRDFAQVVASISPAGLAFVSPILIGDRIVNNPTGPPAQTAVWMEDLDDGRIVGGRPPAHVQASRSVIQP